MSAVEFVVNTANIRPPSRRGRPADPLPVGLSDEVIRKLRRRAERMAMNTDSNVAVIFTAKVMSALAEHGLARLTAREVLSLAAMAADVPQELGLIVAAFVGSHPPVGATFPVLREMLLAGAVGGVAGLRTLHAYIKERQRKAAAKAKARRLEAPADLLQQRPKLLPRIERLRQRQRAAIDAQREAEQRESAAAIAALARLYAQRDQPPLQPHRDLIETAQTLSDRGFPIAARHRAPLIALAAELLDY